MLLLVSCDSIARNIAVAHQRMGTAICKWTYRRTEKFLTCTRSLTKQRTIKVDRSRMHRRNRSDQMKSDRHHKASDAATISLHRFLLPAISWSDILGLVVCQLWRHTVKSCCVRILFKWVHQALPRPSSPSWFPFESLFRNSIISQTYGSVSDAFFESFCSAVLSLLCWFLDSWSTSKDYLIFITRSQ